MLLDLLHAPAGSYLHSLADVMVRVENLSHVLAWARFDESADLGRADALSQSSLHIVSLPRLKLTFQARQVGDSVRLYSVDHADLFITNERDETASLLAGLSHSLLLSSSNGEMSVLVPAWKPVRPTIEAVPFSTELVLDRADAEWLENSEHPYYVYPVHVSLSFLYSTTLASALYLLLLRYLARLYTSVVQLVDTVSSDTQLTDEESQILVRLGSTPDEHPDAHACRLRISLVLLDSPVTLTWDLSRQMAKYIVKMPHVSADCRLRAEEELALLGLCVCDPADRRYDPNLGHSPYSVYLCKNRRSALRAALAMPQAMPRPEDDEPHRIVGPSVECAVDVPPSRADDRWIYQSKPKKGKSLLHGVDSAELLELLGSLSMRYQHQRVLTLESMLVLISIFNDRRVLSGTGAVANTIHTGAFLTLYSLFQGGTSCRVLHNTTSSASQSFATLLLPFFAAELDEPSPLNALLLTLARTPTLGPLLPPFDDTRKHKRRDVLTGLPLPDEENAPLGDLITSALTEVTLLGDATNPKRKDVEAAMLSRRVDTLTKERMWSGFGFGGGAVGGGGSIGGWGAGWGTGGWGSGGSWGGGGDGQTSYQRLEKLAVETEKQCAQALAEATNWRLLVSVDHPARPVPKPSRSALVALGEASMRLPPTQVTDHACSERRVRCVLGCDDAQMHALCTAPLLQTSDRWCTVVPCASLGNAPVSGTLGFDVAAHPDAASKVAKDMQARLAADATLYAATANSASAARLNFLLSAEAIVADTPEGWSERRAAEASLRALVSELVSLREKDAQYVRATLPALLERANRVPLNTIGLSEEERARRELFVLRQEAMQEGVISADLLLCLLISSEATRDLRASNPFVSEAEAEAIFDELVAAVLHASRVGQINRCVCEAHGLLKLLAPATGADGTDDGDGGDAGAKRRAEADDGLHGFWPSEAAQLAAASAITLKAQSLAEQLLTKRHYVHTGGPELSPTGLGDGAGSSGSDASFEEIERNEALGSGGSSASLCLLSSEGTSELAEDHASNHAQRRLVYDPRFLLFEFTHNLVLRRAQVELVREFVAAVTAGQPLVKQMLMGGGKTTVVVSLTLLVTP